MSLVVQYSRQAEKQEAHHLVDDALPLGRLLKGYTIVSYCW
jgi:hypothetical protein